MFQQDLPTKCMSQIDNDLINSYKETCYMWSDGRHDDHQGNTPLATYANAEHPVLITSGIEYLHYKTLADSKRQ